MYRTPPPLAKLAPRASLWRRFLSWHRGTFDKLEERDVRRTVALAEAEARTQEAKRAAMWSTYANAQDMRTMT